MLAVNLSYVILEGAIIGFILIMISLYAILLWILMISIWEAITYLEVCERLSFRGVTCTVISKIKDPYCCSCVGRFSRMASNMICCSFLIWFLIRNNIISHWADFLSYCSDFVRREPFVWGVWLPIAGVSARVGFDVWSVISFFFPISCFTLLWFENVFSNGILFKLNCFMAKCLYIGFLLEGSLSSICCQFL